MTKRDQMVAGVIGIVIIVMTYLVSLFAILNRTPRAQIATPTTTISLDEEVIPLLQGLELNGQLPVTTSPEELGKDDPFTS